MKYFFSGRRLCELSHVKSSMVVRHVLNRHNLFQHPEYSPVSGEI
jgi:hypothetical protein